MHLNMFTSCEADSHVNLGPKSRNHVSKDEAVLAGIYKVTCIVHECTVTPRMSTSFRDHQLVRASMLHLKPPTLL